MLPLTPSPFLQTHFLLKLIVLATNVENPYFNHLNPYFLGNNNINSRLFSSEVFGVTGEMVILIDLTNQILIIVSDTSQSITSRFLNAQNIRTRCTDTALRISIRSIFVVTLVGKNRFFFPEGTYLFKKKKKKKQQKSEDNKIHLETLRNETSQTEEKGKQSLWLCKPLKWSSIVIAKTVCCFTHFNQNALSC